MLHPNKHLPIELIRCSRFRRSLPGYQNDANHTDGSLARLGMLAAIADIQLPVEFREWRSILESEAVVSDYTCERIGAFAGFVPIWLRSDEQLCCLHLESTRRAIGDFHIYFVTPGSDSYKKAGLFVPESSLLVLRFTLEAPWMLPEMHDEDGVYAFTS